MDVWCNGQKIETAVSITVTDTDLLCNKQYTTEFKKSILVSKEIKINSCEYMSPKVRNRSTMNTTSMGRKFAGSTVVCV